MHFLFGFPDIARVNQSNVLIMMLYMKLQQLLPCAMTLQ